MSQYRRSPNILIVSAFLPYPLNIGGKIRIHTLCKLLSHRYNLILLSLIKDEKELNYVSELKKVFKEVHLIIDRSKPKGALYPASYFGSYSKALIKEFEGIKKRISLDLIHIESNELLYLVEFSKDIPVIYTEHDVSALSLNKSYYRPTGFLLSRIFDYFKRLHLHKNLYRKVEKILVLSEPDKKFLNAFISNKDIYHLPTGVDLDHFSFNCTSQNSNRLIFIGWYLHYPNEDAVIYFSKKILPLVKKVKSDVEFIIVGLDPTDRIKELVDGDGIRLVGEVRDVREYLRDSGVFVNPIRLGAGIKGKVLEAMATGVPVVSTNRGSCGIMADNNKEILIADTPYEFSCQIMRLINDTDFRSRLALNARRLIEASYDWRRIADRLDRIYRETVTK